MLFNSLEFLLFLPITFLLYWFIAKPYKFQNLFIIIVSYIFYGWWNWRFLILIAITTFCSYLSGLIIEAYNGNRRKQKIVCMANIILNLTILAYFKYYNFFAENFVFIMNQCGWHIDWITKDILLPVGISFYTFQALSYTIDVYNRKMEPTHDIVAFFAFISFFPQLVAGPIERATHLLPQFDCSSKQSPPIEFDYLKSVDGLRQILWGLFKKIVIADNCSTIVNLMFSSYETQDGTTLFWGAVLFSFQIYGDFSGYSDIAIGTAKLFGIDLMRNFNFPYFAQNIADFWRRWHISLTTWFRDYIYIPLGGSRCKKWKVMRNTLVIFLVSGLWHGANWTFIAWGAYHAILFLPLMLLGMNTKKTTLIAENRMLPSLKEFIQMCITFILVVIGWIIFRAENITQAVEYIYRMISMFQLTIPSHGKKMLLFITLMIIIEWCQRHKQHALQIDNIGLMTCTPIRWGIYLCLIFIIIGNSGEHSDFIYFQF